MPKRKYDETKETKLVAKSGFLSLQSTLDDVTKQVYKDDKCICIYDKYPKAKYHYLLVPIEKPHLKQMNELISSKHLALLKYLKNVVNEKIIFKHNSNRFKIGFHAIQSMYPLHLHIISDDFNSECLKTKRHWNSFNTEYFIQLDKVIEHLELNENIIDLLENDEKLEKLLREDLKCNKCDENPKNLPQLKEHLLKKH